MYQKTLVFCALLLVIFGSSAVAYGQFVDPEIILGPAREKVKNTPTPTITDDTIVILHTKSGKLVIEFFYDDAPNHVKNFVKLVKADLYDRTVFHRIIEDFMIQGGDPKTKPGGYTAVAEWGTGDAGYTIPAEFNNIKHNRGILSMARSTHPDSAGSQYFIVHKDSNFLDQQYTVFGRLVTEESYNTLDAIASLETSPNDIAYDWGQGEILDAEVTTRSEISDILELGEPDRVGTSGKYQNNRLGFEFTSPEGWVIQEPKKTHTSVPDVITVGPRFTDFNPIISITVKNSENKTLDDLIQEKKSSLQSSIDAGKLVIELEQKTQFNGFDTYVTEAIGVFGTNSGPINVKFREYTIEGSDKFYTVTYTNSENNFDTHLSVFTDVLNSLSIQGQPTLVEQENNNQEEGGGCLIATAAFGSEIAPEVQRLRELRDNTILATNTGTSFMNGFNQFYYSFSPTVADWERENSTFKEIVRATITPLLASLSLLNYVEIDSEEEILGYGISIIILNLGMYFVAPIIAIYKARQYVISKI